MVATLLDAAGKAQTAKIVGGQATFTELAAGTYTLVIAYADSSAGNKTITGLTVENKAVAQAITATAAAGVKRIDVDVTGGQPAECRGFSAAKWPDQRYTRDCGGRRQGQL